MSDTTPFGFPEAARRLGVPVRTLRRAIRAGTVPAPQQASALASLSPEWLASVAAAVATSPKALTRASTAEIPAFARYEGTSAWRKYRNRVHAHARFVASKA